MRHIVSVRVAFKAGPVVDLPLILAQDAREADLLAKQMAEEIAPNLQVPLAAMLGIVGVQMVAGEIPEYSPILKPSGAIPPKLVLQ